MNLLHLLWIVPVSATMGAFCMALVAARNNRQCEDCHTRCRDCVWYAPINSNPTAKEIHDILDSGNETGVCRKFTFTENRPVMTRPDGYCHRAERREADE